MSAKMTTLTPEIKVFENEGYDVIISVHDFTSKILSRGLNYIVDLIIWSTFGNSGVSMREVITTLIL